MMKKLPKIYKWEKLVERNESCLVIDYLIRGVTTKNTKKVLGFEKGFERYLYLDKHIYWDKEEVNEILDFVTKEIDKKGTSFLHEFVKKFVKNGAKLFSLGKKLGREENARKSNSKLLSDFNKFCQANWRLSPAMLLTIALGKKFGQDIENLLSLRNLSEEKKKFYFVALTFPEQESTSTKELTAFYYLSSSVRKELAGKEWNENNIKNALSLKELNPILEKYLQDFGWIEARWYVGKGWKEKDIIERMARFDVTQNFEEKIKELNGLINRNKEEVKNIAKELKLSRDEIELVRVAKEYVFVRTYRTDMFNKAGFAARPFLQEIAKRLGLSFEQLIFLNSEEIINELKKAKIENELYQRISKRQKAFGILLCKGKLIYFDGKEIEEIKKQQEITEEVNFDIREIKGITASPGKVTGLVKIVAMDKKGLSDVKNGDILVTSMTTPDFIPAMEKAVAFVTNEGGITCHAAIVSREMKKPCIIGTKIATKVLKDGDLVEVDADKGVVKIIHK